MSHGPLMVLVVNFEDANFTGEIQAELERLEGAGVLKVLDLLFVARARTGEVEVIQTNSIHSGEISQALLGWNDGEPGPEPEIEEGSDVWFVADAVEPGGAAAVAVLEHQWAIPLRAAIVRAGGRPAAAEWVNEEDLAAIGVTLP